MESLLGQRLSDPLAGLDKVLELNVPDVFSLNSGQLVCTELPHWSQCRVPSEVADVGA